jgi:NAD(P)-dependent dehydrogenase (short-subunit alcohol dehydrogenase family)
MLCNYNNISRLITMAIQPLAGKTAFVTGGARRIGRAIALALARAGADVAITFHTSQSEAANTAAAIAALGRRAVVTPCDVRSEASVRAAVAAVIAEFGRLDILVNNAAVFASAALESLTLDQWDEVFATNARGPFLVAREALPHLRTARGRIVNIGSLGATHAWAGHAHYCASKAALHMLSQTMAKAFAPEVSVNCVAPGWIQIPDSIDIPEADPAGPQLHAGAPGEETPGVPHPSQSEAERWVGSGEAAPFFPAPLAGRMELQAARFAAKTPMGRNGSAEDVAQAVLFFATGPHFVTGQTLAVDGGLGLA